MNTKTLKHLTTLRNLINTYQEKKLKKMKSQENKKFYTIS